ncbi:hypothetical protein D3C87_687300 [compost metagenome]
MAKFDAPQYLQLNKGGAMARLSILKMQTSEHNDKRPPSTRRASWRKAREYGFDNWADAYAAMHRGTDTDGANVWVTHCGEYFRDEQDAHDVLRDLHRGWFTDTMQDEKAIGIIARLPHGRFLAGYRWTSNDERVYFGDVHTDADEAAHAADGHAEAFAEMAREDAERWDEARDLETAIEDSLMRLRECIALRHRECMFYIRDEARECIELIRTNRERLSREFADCR